MTNIEQKTSADQRVLSGEIWRAFSEQVAKLGAIVWGDEVADDPLLKAEGAQYLLRFLSAGLRVCVELDDTEHPFIDFSIYNRMSWGLDNPDCNYSYARIDGRQRYRIAGNLGAAANIEFQVTSGHHADGDFTQWQAISALRANEIIADANGDFSVLLSREREADGNWMALDDKASFLLIREYFDDWEKRPAHFTMENLDARYPAPPLTTHTVASRFDLLNQWLEVGAQCWNQFARGIMANDGGDIAPFLPPAGAAALGGQAYGMGSFSLAQDEAIILECEPPDCLFWGFSLCDRFFQTIDYEARQSSLNSHQASLLDGRFIGVISQVDTGVPNWLDPGGHGNGIIAVRYTLTEAIPIVRYSRVKLCALAEELATRNAGSLLDTVTPQERSDTLRARRLAYQQRVKP